MFLFYFFLFSLLRRIKREILFFRDTFLFFLITLKIIYFIEISHKNKNYLCYGENKYKYIYIKFVQFRFINNANLKMFLFYKIISIFHFIFK